MPKAQKVAKGRKKGRKAKKPVASAATVNKSDSQGRTAIPSVTMDKFVLSDFCKEVVEAMQCLPAVPGTHAPVVFITACSGSGAPSLVLQQLVPDPLEVAACESNAAAAHALLVNAKPMHSQTDVLLQRKQPSVFCYQCNRTCATPRSDSQPDLYIAGFPCNKNSLMNPKRFTQDATQTPDAQVFEAVADLISLCQPKVFVLENVMGINKKRGGDSDQQDSPVMTWIMEQLHLKLGDGYSIAHTNLSSVVLSGAQQSRTLTLLLYPRSCLYSLAEWTFVCYCLRTSTHACQTGISQSEARVEKPGILRRHKARGGCSSSNPV